MRVLDRACTGKGSDMSEPSRIALRHRDTSPGGSYGTRSAGSGAKAARIQED
jgi:hypothetical protein